MRNKLMDGMSPEQQKTMQFFANLVKNYGDKLDAVVKEPFFVAAAGHMNVLGAALKTTTEAKKETEE